MYTDGFETEMFLWTMLYVFLDKLPELRETEASFWSYQTMQLFLCRFEAHNKLQLYKMKIFSSGNEMACLSEAT